MSDRAVKSGKQKNAEADVEHFRQDLGPFVVAAESTRMAMVFTDAKTSDNPIIFANNSFLKLSGYERDEVLAQPFNFILASQDDAEAVCRIAESFKNARCDDVPEIRCRRRDGSEFYASIFINRVEDTDHAVVQHFVSLVDTTNRRQAQDQAEMMIDELNHRVKNTLATVQSIVSQAVRNTVDPKMVRESIETRISALSRSHDLLSREKWAGAGLRDLVQAALEPFGGANGRAERFTISGDNIRLPSGPALALGIAFHELATNAVKYGAFSNESGTVSIAWAVETRSHQNWLCLHWREKDGPPVTPPTRRGFGSRVIEQGISHELQGKVKLEYLVEGIVCTMDVPVA